MSIRGIFFALLMISCLGFTFVENPEDHAIYISVIKIQHEKGAETADLYMRVFTDDLKSVLQNKFGYEAIREKETFCSDYENYINRYFKKGFICEVNKKALDFQLSNCEKAAEVYELTFEMNCPINWNTAEIEANYFMELFPKQSNVLHLQDGDTKRFGRTTKGNELLKIRF
ncbi:MAG: DUF6702 family protein [Saprospiraceae bacterium]